MAVFTSSRSLVYLIFLFFILNGSLLFVHQSHASVKAENLEDTSFLPSFGPKEIIAKSTVTGLPRKLIGYWGQGRSRHLSTNPSYAELELGELCATSKFDFIYLSAVRDFSTFDGLPGLDFSFHCSFPANAASSNYKSMRSTTGFGPIKCPKIETGIQTCQSLGKKVYLSLSPFVKFPTDKGQEIANTFWNLFFGGNHEFRPFGVSKLDGIDFAMRITDSPMEYFFFLKVIKSLAEKNNYPLGITVSPQCGFPDAIFGPDPNVVPKLLSPPVPGYPEKGVLPYVDTINAFFTSNSYCSFGMKNKFSSFASDWNKFAVENQKNFLITLSGFGYGYEAYFESVNGDFVPVSAWVNGSFHSALASYTWGVGLNDVSTDHWSFPCKKITRNDNMSTTALNPNSRYSDYLAWAISSNYRTNDFICDPNDYTRMFQPASNPPSAPGSPSTNTPPSQGFSPSNPSSTSSTSTYPTLSPTQKTISSFSLKIETGLIHFALIVLSLVFIFF